MVRAATTEFFAANSATTTTSRLDFTFRVDADPSLELKASVTDATQAQGGDAMLF